MAQYAATVSREQQKLHCVAFLTARWLWSALDELAASAEPQHTPVRRLCCASCCECGGTTMHHTQAVLCTTERRGRLLVLPAEQYLDAVHSATEQTLHSPARKREHENQVAAMWSAISRHATKGKRDVLLLLGRTRQAAKALRQASRPPTAKKSNAPRHHQGAAAPAHEILRQLDEREPPRVTTPQTAPQDGEEDEDDEVVVMRPRQRCLMVIEESDCEEELGHGSDCTAGRRPTEADRSTEDSYDRANSSQTGEEGDPAGGYEDDNEHEALGLLLRLQHMSREERMERLAEQMVCVPAQYWGDEDDEECVYEAQSLLGVQLTPEAINSAPSTHRRKQARSSRLKERAATTSSSSKSYQWLESRRFIHERSLAPVTQEDLEAGFDSDDDCDTAAIHSEVLRNRLALLGCTHAGATELFVQWDRVLNTHPTSMESARCGLPERLAVLEKEAGKTGAGEWRDLLPEFARFLFDDGHLDVLTYIVHCKHLARCH